MIFVLILFALTAVLAVIGTIVTTIRDGYGPTTDARIPAQRPFV